MQATLFLNVFMAVIVELETAIDACITKCNNGDCNNDASNSLDRAVAFYAGSLSVTQKSSKGIMLYRFAEGRCMIFNTCRDNSSVVNLEIFSMFNAMQENLGSGMCEDARKTKVRIAQLMYVPIIQGILRTAHHMASTNDSSILTRATVSAYAAAVVPILHACNSLDARIVYESLIAGRDDDASVNFTAVKLAFEKNYACMGITCANVGGIWNAKNNSYLPGALPCVDDIMTTTFPASLTTTLASTMEESPENFTNVVIDAAPSTPTLAPTVTKAAKSSAVITTSVPPTTTEQVRDPVHYI